MPADRPRRPSAGPFTSAEAPTTPGMFSMIPNAVRSRIARSSRIPILNVLNRPPGVSNIPADRSRSSSTSSTSTDDTDTVSIGATSSISPTPRPGSPNTIDDSSALVPIDGAGQRTGPSSIELDMADVGYRICAAARQQAHSPTADVPAVRRLHIDAIRYLIMALPPDLTIAELEALRENMPQRLLDGQAEPAAPSSTNIRRLTAWWTASLLGWFFFLIPLLTAVTSSALRFERQHQVRERGWAFLQGFYVGLTTLLAGGDLDMPACGNALGKAVGALVVWLAILVAEIACGMEEGWNRAGLGQSGTTDDSRELVQARVRGP